MDADCLKTPYINRKVILVLKLLYCHHSLIPYHLTKTDLTPFTCSPAVSLNKLVVLCVYVLNVLLCNFFFFKYLYLCTCVDVFVTL